MGKGNRKRVFLVDDLPAMRERLRELIADLADVVGAAATPAEAIAGVLGTRPDCVILDYQLEGGTGLEVLQALRAATPDIVFVVLTNHANPQHRRACLDAGARHFFDKSSEYAKVRDVVERIATGIADTRGGQGDGSDGGSDVEGGPRTLRSGTCGCSPAA